MRAVRSLATCDSPPLATTAPLHPGPSLCSAACSAHPGALPPPPPPHTHSPGPPPRPAQPRPAAQPAQHSTHSTARTAGATRTCTSAAWTRWLTRAPAAPPAVCTAPAHMYCPCQPTAARAAGSAPARGVQGRTGVRARFVSVGVLKGGGKGGRRRSLRLRPGKACPRCWISSPPSPPPGLKSFLAMGAWTSPGEPD